MSVMFDAFTHKQPVSHRGRWMTASVVVHALLLLLMWRVMLTAPATTAPVEVPRVTFLSPPPPPPPPGGGKRPEPTKVKKNIVRAAVVQPRPTPPAPPRDEPEDPGEAAGVVGGVAGGVAGGVVGGKIGEFDSRMTPPRLLAGPEIRYTEKALENDVEGLMIVRCILTAAGEVKRCEVRQSVRFMDNEVVQTLQKRRYGPVTLEGRPIDVYYTFRIRLTLPR